MRGFCVMVAVSLVAADPAPAQQPPGPLPAALVAAWQKADARVGWLRPDDWCYRAFRAGGAEGKAGEVPAFAFHVWQAGVLGRLPQPERGFGLSLRGVTDAGLKDLAGLKTLQSLNISGRQVTDAGLKELAALKALQTLGLIGTKVTDAGIAELRQALPATDISR